MHLQYDWRIIGHSKILAKLEQDLLQDNIASATLLVGPAEIGKARIIKTLAKILECNENFSHDLQVAKQIEKNIFSDLIAVGALWQKDKLESFDFIGKSSNFDQSHRKSKNMRTDTISIDDVRAFTERLYEKPNAKYKICLIKNIHRMNMEAANAFLKVLEEPPVYTKFLLTASHEKLLPETVISRTRVIHLGLVNNQVLIDYLTKHHPELTDAKVAEMVSLSQGRPARMQKFLSKPDFLLQERSFFHEIADILLKSSIIHRMQYAEKIAKNNENIKEFFDRLLHFLRSILIEKIEKQKMPINENLKIDQIINLITKTNQARLDVDHNVNKRLVLENLLISF